MFAPNHELLIDDFRGIVSVCIDMDAFLDYCVCPEVSSARKCSYPVPIVFPVRYLKLERS